MHLTLIQSVRSARSIGGTLLTNKQTQTIISKISYLPKKSFVAFPRFCAEWNSFWNVLGIFHQFLVVKWHSFPNNYAFGNDTCSAMHAISATGFKGIH